jgi:hypothetical protein
MKDIRETQGRSKSQIKKNYEISGIIWSSGLIFVIVYSIINILT